MIMIVKPKFIFFLPFFTVVILLAYFSSERLSDVELLRSNAIDHGKGESQNDVTVADDNEIDLSPAAAENEIGLDIPSSTIVEHGQATTSTDPAVETKIRSDNPSSTIAAPSQASTSTAAAVETEIKLDIPSSTLTGPSQATTSSPAGHDIDLDVPSSTIAEHNKATTSTSAEPTATDNFGDDWWFFQDTQDDYRNPKFDPDLKSCRPRNYKGEGYETYATFFSTRDSSLHDPYFLATQQIIYRLLWDPRSNNSHPVVVFVAPYISQIQRNYFMAAGAMVRELELVDWQPTVKTTVAPRWKEMFSKLNMWKQTDFSRILYLDTDAFPLTHLDELFDVAKEQTCKEKDGKDPEACQYVFTAVAQEKGYLNAGLLLLKPDLAMHARLIRDIEDRDAYDQNMVEQAFLNHEFSPKGPFPAQLLERKWNALYTTNEDEGKINVIHEKIWIMLPEHFASNYFKDTWDAMIRLYESDDFVEMRREDGAE